MTELKAGVIRTPHNEGMSFDGGSDHISVEEGETEFYLKSEADEVIRRQKYKRCLNMAKWCFTRSNYFFVVGRNEGGIFAKDNFRRSNLYSKWRDRWNALAEQFKEAKCR